MELGAVTVLLGHQTFRSLSLSTASVAPPPTGATLGFEASFPAFPLAFCEVESLGNSFVKGMNSGDPGKYLRSGSGTLKPYCRISCSVFQVAFLLTVLTSGVWKFSSKQQSALSVAQSVELSACTYFFRISVCNLAPNRISRARDW